MKQGWEVKQLRDVCSFEKLQGIHKNLPYIGLENIESHTARFIGSSAPQSMKSSTFKFTNEHLLYGRLRPYLNKVFAPDFTGHCSTEIFPIKPNKELYRKYLLYWFLTDRTVAYINATCTGTRMPRADMNEVLDFDFPIPSLPEQKRIVAILDEAFAAIAKAKENTEKNLKNAREVFDSYLQSVFTNKGEGWEEKSLEAITSKIGSGATPRGGNESYKESGISLIRSMNVHDRQFREKNLAFIDEAQAKELANVTLQENDVLLNITGASVARCCILPKKYLPARVNQHVSIIRAKQDVIDPNLLNLILTSKFYKNQLLLTGEQGATRQAITKAQLQKFEISFPKEKTAQKIIVEKLNIFLKETKKLEAIYQQKLDALGELKKSLLQKAFAGEL